MAPNPVTIARKCPFIFRSFHLSRNSVSQPCFYANIRFPTNPLHISSFSLSYRQFRTISCPKTPFHELGHSKTEFRHLGFDDNFWVMASSDGGYGSFGASGGGDGGGSGGGSGDAAGAGGGADNNWSLLSWYLALLEKHPVLTKAVTSAFLTLVGDLICQIMIDQVPSLDVKRTFLFTLLGFVLVGPTLHFWYLHLSKLVPRPGASGAFLRLLLDQFIFSPTFIGVFLATLVTLEGRPSQVVPKLQQEWFSAVLANWQLWIPFQFLNFRFVPQQFQVLAANLIALVWNVILSFKAHKEILP
ncbi:Mpv17/PMP22 [Dillenia turbinata]|uniref:Mpv17/PMP22 n=1 Tax=Dillenia turbinata TaxID=194707 RepID=A0AAN8W5R3_9MAGN